MNPEEFDKRLSESFKSEFLPPDKQLWQNIGKRLDQGNKRPLWHWLVPVMVLAVVIGGWLMSGPFARNSKQEVNHPLANNESAIAPKVNETVSTADINTAIETTATVTETESKTSVPVEKKKASSVRKTTLAAQNTGQSGETIPTVELDKRITPFSRPATSRFTTYFEPSTPTAIAANYKTFLRMKSLISPVMPQFTLEKESPIAYDAPFKDRKAYRSPYSKNPVDFDSKWWWNVGLGPQVAFNKAIVPSDSQAYVHKTLWANTKRMTNNGSGFHAQFLLGRKVGKYFSIESGLQYNIHSEDIKFNFSSTLIETRDTGNHIIKSYQDNVYLWFVQQGHTDTTWYQATRAFSLAVKNRYSIITLPVKFNFEYNLSERTKFVAGIGAGITSISSRKSTHLNLVHDSKETLDKKVHQFTASVNAQFGFYTNFNDIGQLGVYSGFQMYTKPWELANKQYAISMSDLQLGISFRRPLNW